MLFKTSERVCRKVLFLPVMNENVFGPPNVHLCSCLSIHLSICRRSLIPLRTDDAPTHEWTYKGIELPSIRRRAPPRPPASLRIAQLAYWALQVLTDVRPSKIDILNRLPRHLFDNDMSHVFVVVMFFKLPLLQMYNYSFLIGICNE